LIVGIGEIKVDVRKGGFVDGGANVERGTSLYMLAEGTGSAGSREGKEEGRNNGERREKAARKAHDKERMCCSY